MSTILESVQQFFSFASKLELNFDIIYGESVQIEVSPYARISTLKTQLSQKLMVEPSEIVLIHGATVLDDENKSLRKLQIQTGDSIYLYVQTLKDRKDSDTSSVTNDSASVSDEDNRCERIYLNL